MNAREDILVRVRRNRPAGDHPLPLIPHFVIPGGEQSRRLEAFSRALRTMGGRFCRSSEISSPLAWIREHIPDAKIICSAVPEVPSDRAWSAVRKPQDLAAIDAAVVRAVLGVAESGSVLFTEAELKVSTLGYLAKHLVVLLDQRAIVSGLQEAYTHPVFQAVIIDG